MRPILLGVLGLACTGAAAMAGPAAGPVPLDDGALGQVAGGAELFTPLALPVGLLPPQAAAVAQPYLDRANMILGQANVLLVQADALLAGLGATPPVTGTAGAPAASAAGANAIGGS